jgi:hypothetical protein
VQLLQEQLFKDLLGIFRAGHCMSNDTGVAEDLIVIAALEGLVSEKVDFPKVFLLNVSKAVGLVPTVREDIKRDLTT